MYIVFEGPDGSGKSTMMEMLRQDVLKYMQRNSGFGEREGVLHIHDWHQPGSTDLGQELRRLVKASNLKACGASQFYLMVADHNQFVHEHLSTIPIHSEHHLVLQDRHSAISGYVYQVVANNVEQDLYDQAYGTTFLRENSTPDIVILCKSKLDTILKRIKKRGASKGDRYENKKFLRKVVKGYNIVPEKGQIDSGKYLTINAEQPIIKQYMEVLEGLVSHPSTKDSYLGWIAGYTLRKNYSCPVRESRKRRS